jgi:hypothetical protein
MADFAMKACHAWGKIGPAVINDFDISQRTHGQF